MNLSCSAVFGMNLSRSAVFGMNLSCSAVFGMNLSRSAVFGMNLSRSAVFGMNLSRSAVDIRRAGTVCSSAVKCSSCSCASERPVYTSDCRVAAYFVRF